jgi:hypothetical protein
MARLMREYDRSGSMRWMYRIIDPDANTMKLPNGISDRNSASNSDLNIVASTSPSSHAARRQWRQDSTRCRERYARAEAAH